MLRVGLQVVLCVVVICDMLNSLKLPMLLNLNIRHTLVIDCIILLLFAGQMHWQR